MADSPVITDYLALEPLLLAKLEELLPEGWTAHYLTDLGDPRERETKAPAIFAGYAGDGSLANAGEGALNRLYQEYWTVIAVRTASQDAAARDLRSKAGPIFASLLHNDGLAGWTPDRATWAALQYQPGQRPRYYIGYAEYPMIWRTRLTTMATHHRNR
jgi:hypothetical protein